MYMYILYLFIFVINVMRQFNSFDRFCLKTAKIQAYRIYFGYERNTRMMAIMITGNWNDRSYSQGGLWYCSSGYTHRCLNDCSFQSIHWWIQIIRKSQMSLLKSNLRMSNKRMFRVQVRLNKKADTFAKAGTTNFWIHTWYWHSSSQGQANELTQNSLLCKSKMK